MPLLGELNGEGRTIIMVTYSPEWARYTNRILHISDDRLNGEETNSAPLELAAAEFSKPDFSAGRPAVSG
jgi:ABC-type lipoprotein export system ATPase subunit